jgi:hypothetical protein
VVLPLPEPLHTGSVVALRMTSGQAQAVPLSVGFAGGQQYTVEVVSGAWRVYRLVVPPTLEGQRELALALRAPTFIPAHSVPGSVDARSLSLMLSTVRVE